MRPLEFKSLGSVSDPYVGYLKAKELQLELLEKRIRDEIPDTFLFLEHRPVVTRGRGLQFTGEVKPRHMPAPILPQGVEFAESERGGDLTYHGPGQLVIYPIVKLEETSPWGHHDVSGFIRSLERLTQSVLSDYGIESSSRENASGVWVGNKKILSIGVAVRKWVTWHGIALNVVNDLRCFQGFSPCGFDSDVMTRLSDLVALGSDWRAVLEARYQDKLRSSYRECP